MRWRARSRKVANKKKRIVTREREKGLNKKSCCFFLSALLPPIWHRSRNVQWNEMWKNFECFRAFRFRVFLFWSFYFIIFVVFEPQKLANRAKWHSENQWKLHTQCCIGCGSCAQTPKNQNEEIKKHTHFIQSNLWPEKQTNNGIFYMDIFVKYLRPYSLNVMCANIQRRWSGRQLCVHYDRIENVCAFL